MKKRLQSGLSRALEILLCLGTAVIFLLDIALPLGVAAAVPYTIIVFISGSLPDRRAPFVVAALATVLTVVGIFLSPETDEVWKALLNRGIALVVIWGTVLLLAQRRNAEERLEQANRRLEDDAADRAARLESIMEYVPDGVITIDGSGIIEDVNDAAARLFGYEPDELPRRNVSMLMPEPHRSQHDDYIKAYVETGKGRIIDIGPREVTGLAKDGTEIPLELAVGEIQSGDRIRFIGILRDLGERKLTEKRLHQASKLEALGQLTGGISHDFNNLLTVIIGNLNLLKEELRLEGEAAEYLDGAVGASERAAALTRHLLAYARRQVLRPELLDINRLVARTAELLGRTIGDDMDIQTILAGGLWTTVADPGQLESCLINLALNARDAMPGGGKMTIETANTRLDREYADAHQEVSPGQYVMIAVTDTGSGVPPEILDKIFDPFFTTKGEESGTGLGLSMVYGFVKQSAGHVKAYSEPGEGTTIKIYLPRRSDASMTQPRIDRRVPRTLNGSERVLVVEDDDEVRKFVVNALDMLGYTVYEVADGPAAIELVRSLPHIDLLITDVILRTEMNGKQVADAVREIRDIPVLFMSGYTENAIVHRGVLDGNVELLMKPFTRDALARAVRAVLDA